MDRLSKETFLAIVSHLGLQEKLQCILVCRIWNQIISNTLLYKELSFSGTGENFYAAFNLFYGNENFSKQVKRLNIINCEIDVAAELHLPTLFPNVRHLTWRNENVKRSSSTVPPEVLCHELLKNKWDQLVYLNTYMSYRFPFAEDLLVVSPFSKLTTLYIKFQISTTSEDICSILADTTKNLMTLALDHSIVTMKGLEKLHVGVPHLETLNLVDVRLSDEKQFLYMTTITKAESVSIITLYKHIQLTQHSALIVQWLKYFGNKYTNVHTLGIKPDRDSASAPYNPALKDTVSAMISRMENLEAFAVRVCPMIHKIAMALTRNDLLCHVFLWSNRKDVGIQLDSLVMGKRQHISSLYINILEWDFSVYILSHDHISHYQNFPNLSVLSINNFVIDHGVLIYAIMYLPNLVYLHIDKLCVRHKFFSDGTLIDYPKFKMPSKTKIKTIVLGISHSENVDVQPLNKMFATVLPICKRLKRFGLFGIC